MLMGKKIALSGVPIYIFGLHHETKVGDLEKKMFLGLTATKGDWPWLRKAYMLLTGPTSHRICHLCPGDATCPF